MKRYMRCRTTMGHTYYMRRCEDEVIERDLFNAVLVFLPMATVIIFAAIAGLI